MIITISGTPGSGKSTIGKAVASALHAKRYDMGQMWRDVARKRGMTLAELHRRVERNDPSVDRAVDSYQRKLGKSKRSLVVEGRLSFYFIPHSVKVFLYVDPREGARRIWKQLQNRNRRNEARHLQSAADVERAIRQRMRTDRKRYLRYYAINPFLKKHYNLYLDTTRLTERAVEERVRAYCVEKLGRTVHRRKKA